MTEPVFALVPFVDAVVKWLLVVGGAVVGGLAIGFGGNMATRLATTKPMPRWGTLTTRVTGAVLCGWLIYTWNPTVGSGNGDNGDNGNTEKKPPVVSVEKSAEKKVTPDEKKDDKKTDLPPDPNREVVVRIEVLGAKAMSVLKPEAGGMIYRMDDGASTRLFAFDAVRDRLTALKGQHPKLKIQLVQYEDSPARDTFVFGRLTDYLKDREIPFDVFQPGEESPEARKAGK